MAAEALIGGEVSKKAQYLRVLMVELDRIHSHMLCLAHVSENAGYEAKFMQLMGDREPIMDLQEAISGNRVQFDYVSIGGVNRDISSDVVSQIKQTLKELRLKMGDYISEFESNWSLSLRFKGIGTLTKEEAYTYNAIGPLARASGLETDVRMESSLLPYDEVGFKMVTKQSGDIYARNMVRLDEILNSIEMCENIVDAMPEGEIFTKLKGKPEGEIITRLEAPRGELMYYIKGSKKPILDRVRIKTPTFSSIPAFMHIFKGQEYADAPAILASFDPCMSCTAK
jgi:ech hydrogenase subunit E